MLILDANDKSDPVSTPLASLENHNFGPPSVSAANAPTSATLPNPPSSVTNASSSLMNELVHMLHEAITQKQRFTTPCSTNSTSTPSERQITEPVTVTANSNSLPGPKVMSSADSSDLAKSSSAAPQLCRYIISLKATRLHFNTLNISMNLPSAL
ncbi:unnamed protein product [Protopolystoma xenopodis]|uniref:Uncharacterized protein n=1 Tax=Protopolystoma xenopodis TaxID=117903 RepID=A0A3S5BFN9_9PLAT|nr:unnamed protein product [Protopolystoma xenopodis]